MVRLTKRNIGIFLLLAGIPIDFSFYLAYIDQRFCDENLNAVTPHPPYTTLQCSGPDIGGLYAFVVALNTAGATLIVVGMHISRSKSTKTAGSVT